MEQHSHHKPRAGLIAIVKASQTYLRGRTGTYDAPPAIGDIWTWQGEAARIPLQEEASTPQWREWAPALAAVGAAGLGEPVGRPAAPPVPQSGPGVPDEALPFPRIVVSDGARRFPFEVVPGPSPEETFLVFHQGLPPRRLRLEIVEISGYEDMAVVADRVAMDGALPAGFAGATLLPTPSGPVPAMQLEEGSALLDEAGVAVGIRRLGRLETSGARIKAYPELAPLALCGSPGLILAPGQTVVHEGAGVPALMGCERVAIPAGLMRTGGHVRPLLRPGRKVVYVEPVLERPAILSIGGSRLALRGGAAEVLPAGLALADAFAAELILGLGMAMPAPGRGWPAELGALSA